MDGEPVLDPVLEKGSAGNPRRQDQEGEGQNLGGGLHCCWGEVERLKEQARKGREL